MSQISWHKRVVGAIHRLGERHEFLLLDPCVVHLKLPSGVTAVYKPNCVWTWGRRDPKLVIWEVEDAPSTKSVAGEVVLASMCGTNRARILPYEHPLGEDFRKPVRFANIYDRRQKRKVWPGARVRLPRPTKVILFMVFKEKDAYRYYRRYVDVAAKAVSNPFYYHYETWCSSRSDSGILRSLARDESINWLF